MNEDLLIGIILFFGGLCFGLALGMLIKQQYVGTIVIQQTEAGVKLYSLELDGDFEEIDGKKEVRFRVGSPP